MNKVRLHYGLYCLLSVPLIIFIFSVSSLVLFYFQPLVKKESIDFVLVPGTNSQQVAHALERAGVLKHPLMFIVMVRLQGEARNLQAGGYRFYPGIKASQILYALANGKVAIEELMIPDGWTFQEVLAVLAANPYVQHTLTGKSSKEIAHILGIKYDNPEGWFFPDTYYFTWGTSDQSLLRQGYQSMQFHLNAAWLTRDSQLHYRNPYEALIVASMIAKEAKLSSENAVIAAVILNRWRIRMKLQIDPTVIYGMGNSYQGEITSKALRTSTPYNTYVKYGLPPTPICLPGQVAINAALHPQKTKALYFVAKGDGSHIFSETLAEQDKAVRKYILHRD